MFDTENLHWSFNHNRGNQKDFGSSVQQTLSCYVKTADDGIARHSTESTFVSTYNVLPNFWRGYHPRSDRTANGDLRIGRFVLGRRLGEGGRWQYSVHSENSTSGENLQAVFQCMNDTPRTVIDSWQIDAANTAGNLHKQFACSGQITSTDDDGGREVRLSVNGLEFVSGCYRGELSITCPWALYDVIPLIHSGTTDTSEGIEIALLDDLEKLKSPVHVEFLESIDLKVSDEEQVMQLSGYCVYGNGMAPSYWWVDSRSNVVISSTIFQTLVLRNARTQAGVE